jgi:protein-tyrosine phosphatase
MTYIHDNFASFRGLVRLLLTEAGARVGLDDEFRQVDFARVERLVFVCLGNICRSPFGEYIARRHGIPSAGFGLATTTGVPAFELGVETALERGVDMRSHLTTDFSDFEVLDTDLLLVMELRHAHRLKAMLGESRAQIALLGNWARPRRLHIHDPHIHGKAYFEHCYAIIENATENLIKQYLAQRTFKPWELEGR